MRVTPAPSVRASTAQAGTSSALGNCSTKKLLIYRSSASCPSMMAARIDRIRAIMYAMLWHVISCAASASVLWSRSRACRYARVYLRQVSHAQGGCFSTEESVLSAGDTSAPSSERVSAECSLPRRRREPPRTRATPNRAVRVGYTQSNLTYVTENINAVLLQQTETGEVGQCLHVYSQRRANHQVERIAHAHEVPGLVRGKSFRALYIVHSTVLDIRVIVASAGRQIDRCG